MYVLGIHPDGDYFKVALLKCSGKKDLEKLTGDHVSKIDDLLKHKEVELLEV